ncbi:MAG: XisI protein [Bacteroidota bacterium]
MNKVTKYKNIVKPTVQIAIPNDPSLEIATVLIEDEARGHYMLYNDGWQEERRIYGYGCFLHVEVKEDGKVWLQHDGTDLIFGELLLEAGIQKEDMVLGFHAPIMRAETGFAVA